MTKKILIAEDDLASRELAREILQAQGYQVVEVDNGRDALRKIEEETPDLVLMDIQMPVLDGFAVLLELRQNSRFAGLRIVAVTSFAMQGDREKALQAGFDAYLTKPIDIVALRLQIKQLLS